MNEELKKAVTEAYNDCMSAVNKIKNDPFTMMASVSAASPSDWMRAMADDINREISNRGREALKPPRHKRTVWINVYGDHASVFKEKYLADASITINSWVGGTLERIACIRVDLDFEEGEGL